MHQQQIARVLAGFAMAQNRLHALVTRTPDDRWATRSDPAQWSVAECIAHLNLTGRAYVPLLAAAITEARAVHRPAPSRYRRDPMGWLIGTMSGPMLRVGGWRLGRVRTAPSFVPGGELPRAEVWAEFERLQKRQIELTQAADGLPLQSVRVVSPFDARVTYNLYSCLVLLPRHQLRHVDQAERVWAGR